MQITSGARNILSSPFIYNLLQNMFSAKKIRKELQKEYIQAGNNDVIVDLGCGTAEIIECLPEVKYFGYDISPKYISAAKSKFSNRGIFFCKIFDDKDALDEPQADVVLALGLLHHLEDVEVCNVFQLAQRRLNSSGKCITIDPCFTQNQSFIEKILMGLDRGKNVRTHQRYLELAEKFFPSVSCHVIHRSPVPYTHCILECRNF